MSRSEMEPYLLDLAYERLRVQYSGEPNPEHALMDAIFLEVGMSSCLEEGGVGWEVVERLSQDPQRDLTDLIHDIYFLADSHITDAQFRPFIDCLGSSLEMLEDQIAQPS